MFSMAKKKRFYKRKKRKTTSIYEIKAGRYYYIGKSNNPWARLESHKRKALGNEGNNDKKNKVFRQNLHKLEMRILEKPSMTNWREREIYYIAQYRKKYGRDWILNMSDGGDGKSGGGHRDRGQRAIVRGNSSLNTFLALLFILSLCGCLYFFS